MAGFSLRHTLIISTEFFSAYRLIRIGALQVLYSSALTENHRSKFLKARQYLPAGGAYALSFSLLQVPTFPALQSILLPVVPGCSHHASG
jgi:hypothetical protein